MRTSTESRRTDMLGPQVEGHVGTLLEGLAPSDVAAVERLAATLLAAFHASGTPAGLPELVLDAIEGRADERSAAVLSAMVALGRQPVVGLAGARLARLHRAGARWRMEGHLGALEVAEAQVVADDGFQVLLALLRRDGQRHPQLAMVIVDQGRHAGAAVSGFLTPPISVPSIAAAVREATRHDGPAMPPGVDVGPAELAEALGSALARSAAEGVLVSVELAAAVPVLSLALTGDAAAFASVTVDGGHAIDLEVDDDEELMVLIEEVAEHFLEVAGDDAAVGRTGDLVAGTMLDWKWRNERGALGRWTCAELETYLFDYFCGSVLAVEEPLTDVPGCVAAFLFFLDDHGALEGEPLEQLLSFVEDRAGSFVEAAADSANWGLAKTLVVGMWEEGLDPEDPAAVRAWMDTFDAAPDWRGDGAAGSGRDARTRQRRDGRAGPGPARRANTSHDASRAKRKAAKAARRRQRA